MFLLLLLSVVTLFHMLCHNNFFCKMGGGHKAWLAQTLDWRPLNTWAEDFAVETSNLLGLIQVLGTWYCFVFAGLCCLLVRWVMPWLRAILGILQFTVNNTAKWFWFFLHCFLAAVCTFLWPKVYDLYYLCVLSYRCFSTVYWLCSL